MDNCNQVMTITRPRHLRVWGLESTSKRGFYSILLHPFSLQEKYILSYGKKKS